MFSESFFALRSSARSDGRVEAMATGEILEERSALLPEI